MTKDCYSVLGLGQVRARWFSNVSTWSTTGVIPVEFGKCISSAEVSYRLNSLQKFSALIVEAGMQGVDRDLFALAKKHSTACIVVDRPDSKTDWLGLGANAVLTTEFSPSEFLNVLAAHAQIVSTKDRFDSHIVEEITSLRAPLTTVCGSGGVGTSTMAIAITQCLVETSTLDANVMLADFARNSNQAMLHGAPDIVPSIEELVALHRKRRPSAQEVRCMTFEIESRGYNLLLGSTRPGAWTSMTRASIEDSLDSLRRAFGHVVVDTTADFEGEDQSGSLDVEERNNLARIAASKADKVVLVIRSGMKGIYSGVSAYRDLLGLGLNAGQIVCVLNCAPGRRSVRNEQAQALQALIAAIDESCANTPIVAIPDCDIETAHRDCEPLPRAFIKPLRNFVTDFVATRPTCLPKRSTTEVQAIRTNAFESFSKVVGE